MEYDAWDEGTVELCLEEEAAYLRVCHQIYRRKGPIPNSTALLSTLWRCHKNKVSALLRRLIEKGKITLTPEGYLTNTRATQEIHRRETVRTHRVHAGHTGGIRSGETRRKSLENNDTTEAVASTQRTRGEERRGEERRGEESPSPNGEGVQVVSMDEKTRLYARAKELLGGQYGGITTDLLKAKGGVVSKAMAVIESSASTADPKRYIRGAIAKSKPDDRYADLDPRAFGGKLL